MAPLASTANVTRPRALGYGARIGTLWLPLAISPDRPLELESAPLEAPRVRTEQQPEEISNSFGQLFARAEFTGGEGLDFAHRRDRQDRDARRFWDSKNICICQDDPGELTGFHLLHETAEIEDTSNTNLFFAYDGTALYWSDGTAVERSTDFLTAAAGSVTHSSESTGTTQTIEGLASLGEDVYAAAGSDGVVERDGSAGTWSRFDDTNVSDAQGVWTAKGFVIAADSTILATDLTGSPYTTLVTLPAGEEWLDVRDAGAAILACASDGYIYAIAEDGSGGLELKGQTRVGTDETPTAVAEWEGFVDYATKQDNDASGALGRLYRAELTETNGQITLTNSTLMRQWGSQTGSTDQAPRRLYRHRHSVYAGVDEGTDSHLWRHSFVNGGLNRDLRAASASGLVTDIIAVSDKLFLAVAGEGLYREEDTYETDGYLMGPLADFFTAEEKAWVGAILDTEDVSDGRIELYRTTDPAALSDDTSSSWTRVKNVKSGSGGDETAMTNVEGRFLAGMVKIHAPSSQSSTPTCRSFTFRAYPGPSDQLIRLPVNVSDVIQRPGRRRLAVRGHGRKLYDQLKQREGTYQELHLVATEDTFGGTVEKVSQPMLDESLWPFPVVWIEYRGRRQSMISGTNSGGAMGVGTMGIMTQGGIDA